MFGKQFKELRVKQNISLKEAAQDVVAVSTLSRWENDQTELQLDKVIELLDNIHISPLEFLSITVLSPRTPLIDEISKAQSGNSVIELKRIATRCLHIYKQTHNKYDLFNAAIACNFYYELSHVNIFPKNYSDTLEQYLSDTIDWTHYYISIFGNSVYLLNPKRVYGFSLLIIDNLEQVKRGGYEYYLDTILTILNAYEVLIYEDLTLANKLSNSINNIHISHYSLYAIVKRKYLNALLNYKKTGNNSELSLLKYHLKGLGLEDLTI